MIFFSQTQLSCALIFIFLGLILGFLHDLVSVVFFTNFQNNLIKTLIFSIFYSFFSVLFIIFLNFYNFGNFSLTLLFTTLIGFIWMKKLTNKTVVILQKSWYNKIRSLVNSKKKSKEKQRTKIKDEISIQS